MFILVLPVRMFHVTITPKTFLDDAQDLNN